MNVSGRAVAALAGFYKIATEEILVVHDELDLPPGAARLKQGGGVAGHNGLKDISAKLGPEFWRLRLGIGHPGDRAEVVNYVLHPPRVEEADLISDAIERSLSVATDIRRARWRRRCSGCILNRKTEQRFQPSCRQVEVPTTDKI